MKRGDEACCKADALLQICDCRPTFSFASPKEKVARQKFPFFTSPLASPLGRARGRCKYVLLSKFRWHLLLTALVQRHNEANLMPTTTGGAYYSARIVTQCECRSFQIVFLLKLHCSMHQPYPAPLFSPIFSGKAEKIGPSET